MVTIARLTLKTLGPFVAAVQGQGLPGLSSTKARALLSYLAVESHRAHHREALATLLWPDQDADRARVNLRKALSLLRRALGGGVAAADVLLTAGHTVRLAPDRYDLDCARFSAILDRTVPEWGPGAALGAADIQALADALALYQGPFLDQMLVDDSVLFTEWQVIMRERLHRRAVEACAALIAHCEHAQSWAEARKYAKRYLELDPWDEQAHRCLMRAQARLGQRLAALAQYERCRHILAQELGVSPEPETIALVEQIRAGAESPAPAAARSIPPAAGRRGNLPTPATRLVGRGRELAALAAALGAAEPRVLTLTGAAGCGKTRLALALAERGRPLFGDGAFFVPLADLQTHAQAVGAILGALGAGASGDEPRLTEALGDRQALIILDSCEHLPDVGPLIGRMLRRSPLLKVLCTSRASLQIYGEWSYRVPALPVSRQRPGGAGAAGEDAVDLFVSRAQAANHAFELTPHNLAMVVAICEQLEGLPLALELAATYLRYISLGSLAQLLSRSLATLTSDLRDVPARHRSLFTAIKWTYDLLTPSQQQLLGRLSRIGRPFTVDEMLAQHTGGAPQQLTQDLYALADHHLLRLVAAGERYEMGGIVRAFAAEQLRGGADGAAPPRPLIARELGLGDAERQPVNEHIRL